MKNYLVYVFDWQGTLYDSVNHKLFAGATELLSYLKTSNLKTALATNMDREFLVDELESLEIADKFDYIKTSSECRSKPYPDMINEILAESGVDKEQLIMIGDSDTDIMMGNFAGVNSVGISKNSCVNWLELPTYKFADILGLHAEIVAK